MSTMKNIINSDNWTFCYKAAGSLRVQVNLTAEPAQNPEDSILYSVTVIKNDKLEISVTDFQELTQACSYINERYKNWRLVDQTDKPKDDGSGCSTCVAH